MTTALISPGGQADEPPLAQDLASVGIQVLAEAEATRLLNETIRLTPDLIVWHESHPDEALFTVVAAIEASSPRPFVIFTNDPDAQKIDRATQSGVHSYIINGYSRQRLRSVIKVAQARFRYIQLLKDELGDVNRRFEERKLVDRAKGILMGARQIREDEAFRILRTQSMRMKRRIGQVAQQIIASARYAEAVNLSGQLRMLSQRIVKHFALTYANADAPDAAGLLQDSRQTVKSNLQILSRSISLATFGDLFDNVSQAWKDLDDVLDQPATAASLLDIDARAEKFLAHAETLTTNLEVAGFGAALHIINVAGRQRMLSQRMAKHAIMATLLKGAPAEAARSSLDETGKTFVEAFAYLKSMPLSTEGIRTEIAGAEAAWDQFKQALGESVTPEGRRELAFSSETLLGHFDRLTEHYERSIQILLE